MTLPKYLFKTTCKINCENFTVFFLAKKKNKKKNIGFHYVTQLYTKQKLICQVHTQGSSMLLPTDNQ